MHPRILRGSFPEGAIRFNFPEASTNSAAGTIRSRDLNSDPFLGTLPKDGVSQNVDVYQPCTLNVLHVHPRASEIYYLINGTLEVGVQEEAPSGRFLNVNLQPGSNAVIPQGLPHYVYNNACEPANLLQFWDSSDPGNVIIYGNFVRNFPSNVIAAHTGLDPMSIAALSRSVPQPNGGIIRSEACLAACSGQSPTGSPAGRH
ncbi:hypothetical protein WJX73_004569 [Symbiochloris irregularis]|uniref:Germin-like protein n=1 Tax=Symbiochloris irregularis TaxID=706552 RepID=A0AAW1P3P1_9CHLO